MFFILYRFTWIRLVGTHQNTLLVLRFPVNFCFYLIESIITHFQDFPFIVNVSLSGTFYGVMSASIFIFGFPPWMLCTLRSNNGKTPVKRTGHFKLRRYNYLPLFIGKSNSIFFIHYSYFAFPKIIGTGFAIIGIVNLKKHLLLCINS